MTDLKETLFLPKTSFSMRGNLAEKEPAYLQKWEKENLYQKLRTARAENNSFLLHWGPPYANGNLHAGHALNAILKDILTRMKSLLGYNAPLVPGWDCHGLPIEWKIEESLAKEKKNKAELSPVQFRQLCRDFAKKWVAVQSEQFERLGILCDLEKPYLTMDFASEASIARTFLDHLEKGYVVRGERPIMWSVVEQTALAEAEVEYIDKESDSIYVAFKVKQSPQTNLKADLKEARFVIWTTTPWTIPGNRAIAYGEELEYTLVKVASVTSGTHLVRPGDQFVVAQDLVDAFKKGLGIETCQLVSLGKGADVFPGVICEHPLVARGYDVDVPLLPGEHVTTQAGTGLVHTAPAHGPDDFLLGKKYGLEIADTVQGNGLYRKFVKEFAGLHIFKSEPLVISALEGEKALLAHGKIKHSYPHSWRSKKPLIYRTTPQWFVSLEHKDLRGVALQAIEKTRFIPEQGKNRIRAMVQDRPDWCVSRQRTWGVPLPLIINRETHEPIIDPQVNDHIIKIFEAEGTDAWFERDVSEFLTPDYDPKDFEKVMDILDVWFESGATQRYVLEARPDLDRPCDLYLEGSDQHRGWFQSSLLVGAALYGDAPFKEVLTHGFVLDEHGYKMSKSKGDALSPIAIAQKSGIEILRLWVASTDYGDDVKLGEGMLKAQQDIYRRYRNTLRYLLGALQDQPYGSDCDNCDGKGALLEGTFKHIDYEALPILERFVLAKVSRLQAQFLEASKSYQFQEFYRELHTFCATDLSAFYFDVRKDTLYCDDLEGLERKATLQVMNVLIHSLTLFLSPVLPFTTEDVWQTLYPESDSIHLQLLSSLPKQWVDEALISKMDKARTARSLITAKLEEARRDGVIGSSLEAEVMVRALQGLFDRDIDFEALTIVSKLAISEAAGGVQNDAPEITVKKSVHEKCDRCWKHVEDVTQRGSGHVLCNRCDHVVRHHDQEHSPHMSAQS